MAQVKIRPERGVKLEQLELPVIPPEETYLRELENITKYERAILRILQRRGPMTAQELQRATKLSSSTVTARLAELGKGSANEKGGKGLITVVGMREIKTVTGRARTVYVYDLTEKAWLLVESTA